MNKFETDTWTAIKARWFTDIPVTRPRAVRVIVIHDMEAPEKGSTAEDVARYFATTATKASAHICVDDDSIIQCVPDGDVAYAAPGCNNDGIQIELAGYANQSHAQWLDTYGVRLLANAAHATAQYCLKYGIPPVHLTDAQLALGARGIVGHAQVTAVYRQSTHTDPGPNFPWNEFMGWVVASYTERKAKFSA